MNLKWPERNAREYPENAISDDLGRRLNFPNILTVASWEFVPLTFTRFALRPCIQGQVAKMYGKKNNNGPI